MAPVCSRACAAREAVKWILVAGTYMAVGDEVSSSLDGVQRAIFSGIGSSFASIGDFSFRWLITRSNNEMGKKAISCLIGHLFSTVFTRLYSIRSLSESEYLAWVGYAVPWFILSEAVAWLIEWRLTSLIEGPRQVVGNP